MRPLKKSFYHKGTERNKRFTEKTAPRKDSLCVFSVFEVYPDVYRGFSVVRFFNNIII